MAVAVRIHLSAVLIIVAVELVDRVPLGTRVMEKYAPILGLVRLFPMGVAVLWHIAYQAEGPEWFNVFVDRVIQVKS